MTNQELEDTSRPAIHLQPLRSGTMTFASLLVSAIARKAGTDRSIHSVGPSTCAYSTIGSAVTGANTVDIIEVA